MSHPRLPRPLLRAVRRCAVFALLCAAVFSVGAQLSSTVRYRSCVPVYVSARADMSSPVSVRDCLALLQTDRVLSAVAAELQSNGYTVTQDALRRAVTVQSVSGSALLEISAETEEAHLSRQICSAYADTAVSQLSLLRCGTATTLGEPQTSERVAAPLWQAALLGAAAGAAVAALWQAVAARLRRVTDGGSVRRLGLPLLGSVPRYVSARSDKGGAAT